MAALSINTNLPLADDVEAFESPAGVPVSPVSTPPGYVNPPMERVGPNVPDPHAELRAKVQKEAEDGCLCPVGHCSLPYFRRSEWVFCVECEWRIGHARGEASGALAVFGGPVAEHAADIAAGRVIRITRAGLDEVFKAPDTHAACGVVQDRDWQKLSPAEDKIVLTHPQLHNLLVCYEAPTNCLTDERWLALQAAWA